MPRWRLGVLPLQVRRHRFRQQLRAMVLQRVLTLFGDDLQEVAANQVQGTHETECRPDPTRPSAGPGDLIPAK